MRNVKKVDMLRLVDIAPECTQFVVLRLFHRTEATDDCDDDMSDTTPTQPAVNDAGFEVVGRIIPCTVENSDTPIMSFVMYKDRVVRWSDYFAELHSNIWTYLDESEPEAEIAEVYTDNIVKGFEHATYRTFAFSLTEIEFNHVVPRLLDGEYTFYIERRLSK